MIQTPNLNCAAPDSVLDRINDEAERLLQQVRHMSLVRASSVMEMRTYVNRMRSLMDELDLPRGEL